MQTPGYDLWVVGYGSITYRKINWWTSFLVAQYIDQQKLREGQLYLLGTENLLPNKWTLFYAGLGRDPQRVQLLRSTWQKLNSPRTCLWIADPEAAAFVQNEFSREIDDRLLTVKVDSDSNHMDN